MGAREGLRLPGDGVRREGAGKRRLGWTPRGHSWTAPGHAGSTARWGRGAGTRTRLGEHRLGSGRYLTSSVRSVTLVRECRRGAAGDCGRSHVSRSSLAFVCPPVVDRAKPRREELNEAADCLSVGWRWTGCSGWFGAYREWERWPVFDLRRFDHLHIHGDRYVSSAAASERCLERECDRDRRSRPVRG
jgi:hypothetical protein